jgi:hypothetical protein
VRVSMGKFGESLSVHSTPRICDFDRLHANPPSPHPPSLYRAHDPSTFASLPNSCCWLRAVSSSLGVVAGGGGIRAKGTGGCAPPPPPLCATRAGRRGGGAMRKTSSTAQPRQGHGLTATLMRTTALASRWSAGGERD